MKNIAIIPARGGSKGLPQKNIKLFCGKPLIAWTILQCKQSKHIDSVWVTSDSDEILSIASEYEANPIKRPSLISGDEAPSESAWLHALNYVENKIGCIDLVLGLQVTSPLRETEDIDNAFDFFFKTHPTSLFSSTELRDYFIWEETPNGSMTGVNHDFKNRKRRQCINPRFLENGSFYIFPPQLLRETGNRLGGKIATYAMADFKKFQIDSLEDFQLCEVIMKGYGLDKSYE